MYDGQAGFSVEMIIGGSRGERKIGFRYRCPWCSENTNVLAHGPADFSPADQAWVVVCQGINCRKPSLILVRGDVPTEIHPNPRVKYKPPGVPEEIAEDVQEALNCQASGFRYGAAVVGRRALQNALIEKGATAHNLVDQINEIDDDSLPKQLKIASQHVRLIGNDAAHVREVTADDVEILVRFVQQVLYQLYTLPYELNEASAKRTIAQQHMPAAKGKGKGKT